MSNIYKKTFLKHKLGKSVVNSQESNRVLYRFGGKRKIFFTTCSLKMCYKEKFSMFARWHVIHTYRLRMQKLIFLKIGNRDFME